jgi:hypothetical protein
MLLDNIQFDADVESSGDFVPSGGGSFTRNTGLYNMVVEMAYMGQSRGGAVNVTVHLKDAAGDGSHRETFYITSGEAKGRKSYYLKDGRKIALPGFEMIDSLCVLATGNNLQGQTIESKMVKLWDWDQRKEVPQNVEVITSLVGKAIRAGIQLCEANRRVNDGSGNYVDGPEKRTFNEISKLFSAKGSLTLTERQAGLTDGEFIQKWLDKNPSDYVRSTYTEVEGPATSSVVEQASAAAATASADENADLFS